MTKQEALHDLIDSAVSRRKFAKSPIAGLFFSNGVNRPIRSL